MVEINDNDIREYIVNGNKDNANMSHNPETIHKHVADNIMKKYSLAHLPEEHRKAHVDGFLHIHDLEYFFDRGLNCCQHDLRYFIKNGLCVDGSGDHTSRAEPPSHLETVMSHSGEILLSAQQDMSGGQGFPLWNVFVAPFAYNRSYEDIVQCMQMFVYNLNMAYASRGGQVPFTSIALEFTVPDFLMDEPAYGPGGEVVGVYGDFVDETRMILRAFTEVLLQGDATGKPHLFPNTMYVLREEVVGNSEFEDDIRLVHELCAKYGTNYFLNMLPDYQGDLSTYMGCRTRLSNDWTGNPLIDCLRTGNLAYITLNLPRMAYDSKDEDGFYELVDEYMDIARSILHERRDHAIKCKDEYCIFPFLHQSQGNDGEYYRIDNSSLTFGFVGLNEALKYMTGKGVMLDDHTANPLGYKIVEHMNDRVDEYKKDSNYQYRYGVIQTPAESTAHRFARIDFKKRHDQVLYEGTRAAPYYTNSSHVPVTFDGILPEKLIVESKYHPLTRAGHILHAFMGEGQADVDSLMGLTEKICKNTDIGFWDYSMAFSQCLDCKTTMRGLQEKCVNCGHTDNVEWYDRITGYVQQVGHAKNSNGGWNRGKRQELLDRHRFTEYERRDN